MATTTPTRMRGTTESSILHVVVSLCRCVVFKGTGAHMSGTMTSSAMACLIAIPMETSFQMAALICVCFRRLFVHF